MKLYKEFDLNEFEAWSGAIDTKETIVKNDKVDTFNMLVMIYFQMALMKLV